MFVPCARWENDDLDAKTLPLAMLSTHEKDSVSAAVDAPWAWANGQCGLMSPAEHFAARIATTRETSCTANGDDGGDNGHCNEELGYSSLREKSLEPICLRVGLILLLN